MRFVKFDNLKSLNLLNLGFNPRNFGSIFAFVDYGNVQHWYDDERRKGDGLRLGIDEIFYVDIKKLGQFLDLFTEHKRFYYGHIPNRPASLHIIVMADRCKFKKITKPVHRTRHYIEPQDKIYDKVKKYKDEYDKNYILIPKCNFDVEITLDAVRRIKDYDTFLLFSSDRDFEKLLQFLKRKNKNIILIGGGHVSNDLKRYSDKFVPARYLKQIITSIKKTKARP